jgi:hypothetical protein
MFFEKEPLFISYLSIFAQNLTMKPIVLIKPILVFSLVLFTCFIAVAQDEKPEEIKIGNIDDAKLKKFKYSEAADTLKPWRITGNLNLGLNQAALINWAPGGENLIGISSIGFLKAVYIKNKLNWTSTIDAGLGMQKNGKKAFRKNDDRLEINSQLNYKASKSWYYSIMMNFRSQFAPGYDYPNDSTKTLVSKSLSPGFLTLGIGMDFKPVDYFSLFISPVTSKTVFVLDNVNIDETKYGITSGEKVFQNLGAFLNARFNKEVVKNVTINTQVSLFSNYLQDPQNIDINWLTGINMKVNKFLSVALVTELVYDHDIDVPKTNADGTTYKGKGTQFREVLSIGLGYQFNNDKRVKK